MSFSNERFFDYMDTGGGFRTKLSLLSSKIRPLFTNKILLVIACMGLFLNLGQAGFLSLNEASSVVIPFQSGYSYNTLFLKPINAQTKNTSPVKMKVTITAYSSTVDQCDEDPFITASGHMVEDGIIAANFLPFNTKVRIPAIYGDRVFVVKDRMNEKYTDRIDVWFDDTSEAIDFGVRSTYIEVF